jgi:folate-binding protein YgfZ
MISLPLQALELSGADAAAFAHAQFCNDVLALPDGHWQWNAWLSAQGRVRAFFHLLRRDASNFVLLLRGGDAQWLRAELSRFVFRAKVQLRTIGDAGVGATQEAAEISAIAGEPPEAFAILGRAGIDAIALPGDPPRWLLYGALAQGDADALERWRLADIRAGLPEIGAGLRDQLLPQSIGLDRLDAVSVRKGCYPGQEIMARLHFKGGNKRSLYRLRWPGSTVPHAGTQLRAATAAESGVIVTAARDAKAGTVEALASLPDVAADAAWRMECSPASAIEIVQRFA